MAKGKPVNDVKGSEAVQPGQIQLTNENAVIFAAKFLEGIQVELRKIRELLEVLEDKNG